MGPWVAAGWKVKVHFVAGGQATHCGVCVARGEPLCFACAQGVRAPLYIGTAQLTHWRDTALPLSQHEQAPGRKQWGDKAPELGFGAGGPCLDALGLGRTSWPLPRAPLASQLGEILSRRAHGCGTFLPGIFSPQRCFRGLGQSPWLYPVTWRHSGSTWSGQKGEKTSGGGSGFTVGASAPL